MSETTTITIQTVDGESTLDSYFVETVYSPLGLRKVVNQILSDLETGKVLPGPMFYTYAHKGMIDGKKWAKGTGAPKIQFTREAVLVWVTKYLTKNVFQAESESE
jgi:hypothetical protein